MIRACIHCGKDYEAPTSLCPDCLQALTPEQAHNAERLAEQVFRLLATTPPPKES